MGQAELAVVRTPASSRVLDSLVAQESVRTVLDAAVEGVEAKLTASPEAALAWEPVPLSAYAGELPDVIRSSWVFVVRAGACSGPERHPNSRQRMVSYRGSGDLQVWSGAGWRSNHLVSHHQAPIRRRWVSVPPNTWHQAVAGEANWAVVSFHTVSEDALIEERPEAGDHALTRRRLYVESDSHTRDTPS